MKQKYGVFSYICLIIYILCIGILIVEAGMDGVTSASQSNAVGGSLANFFNDIKGDQTVAIIPTDLNIKNKIEIGYVGDTYKLEIETLPSDSTYKSTLYSSSNDRVASINNEGIITFLNPGHTTIEAVNEKYTSIKDSFNIEVLNVNATSFSASINNATKDENNIYTLYLAREYNIDFSFIPENTTIKSVTYEYDSSYLAINEEGVISPKKYSANKVLDINIFHNDLSYTLSIKIEHENIVKLSNYDLLIPNNELYVTQVLTPSINIIPSNATFKDYTLVSSNEKIVKIEKNKNIRGISSGKVSISIESNYYEDIKTSIEVEVLPQPDLIDFTPVNTTIYVGEETKLEYKKIPEYAKDYAVTYKSNNESIATINSKGTIKGISNGSVDIEITINNITKICKVNVKASEITGDEDFELNILNSELNYGEEYKISDIVQVSKWIPEVPSSTTLSYELKDSSIGTITKDKITLNKIGVHELFITHNLTNKTHSIILNCTTHNFDFIDLNNNSITNINLTVNQSFLFRIINSESSDNSLQTYELENLNKDIVSISSFGDYYEIVALDEGTASINVTPYIGDETDDKIKNLTINVSHQYTSLLNFTIIDNKSNKEIGIIDRSLDVYINSNYSIKTMIDNIATISKVRYSSSNSNIVTIEANGNLKFNNIGTATITILEEYSNISISFNINVYNYIALNVDTPFTLEGKNAEKIGDNTYAITNGYSGHINLNFLDSSTYKVVQYYSSDEKIATIGQDGTITPLKAGTTTITIVCDDGMQEKIQIEIELKIKKQDYIQNLSEFFYDVRKGLGHFSAFLILGIFSSLTWLLFLNGKKMFFSTFINFGSGFIIACITELIQLYVPGRYGAFEDVLLDYRGFMVSAITITLIFLLTYFIKWIEKVHKYYKIKNQED